MSASAFGLDPALAPAMFGLLGSLVGAGAAIGGQFLTQKMTNNREARETRRRVKVVHEIFAARARTVAILIHSQIAVIRSELGMAHPREARVAIRALGLMEAFESLRRDYENTDFVLSLDDPATVKTLGISIPNIGLMLRACSAAIESESVAEAVGTLSTALESANRILAALGHPAEDHVDRLASLVADN